MKHKLTTSTAGYGLGLATSRRLFKIGQGQYAGRLVAVVALSATDIGIQYADPPYRSWSAVQTVVSDSADLPFDVLMDGDSNIHVVYAATGTAYLKTRKLTFSGGSWTPDFAVEIYSSQASLNPSIAVDTDETLWVAFAEVDGGFKSVRVKSSSDGGQTWGSGPTDPGDLLADGLSSTYTKIVSVAADVWVIYNRSSSQLVMRSRPVSSGTWADEYVIASGPVLDSHFDAAVSDGGAVGVVFDNEQLRYREFNCLNWESIVVIDSDGGESPQLTFDGEVPIVAYLSAFAESQMRLMYSHRFGGQFSEPVELELSHRIFDSVVLYDSNSATYSDLTDQASSATTGDVVHPQSSALLSAAGDAIFLGMLVPIRFLRLLLSTAGTAGTTTFAFWDGTTWQSFTPESGPCALDAVDHRVVLWDDLESIPATWQPSRVNDQQRFWLRIEAATPFAVAPVGSRITAISPLEAVCVRR